MNAVNQYKSNYFFFFTLFWPLVSEEKLIISNHIKYICDELTELGHYIIERKKPPFDWYIINIPPGSSKSTMVSILWPCWLLLNDPSLFIIGSSYSSDISNGFVRKSKKVLDSEIFKALFNQIEFSKQLEGFYETKNNGGYYATSTDGTITGVHGNVFINDDPLSVKQSYSKAERDRGNRFVSTISPDRVRNKEITPQVIVMQRLHDEDPTGHILSKGLNTKHICLPAELGNNTTKGLEYIYTDKLLDPVRINQNILTKRRQELGVFGYAGQYDQNPHPEGGGKIKGEWFNYIHEKELPEGIVWDIWVDGAYTNSTKNDPTGLMVCGFKDGQLYIRNGFCAYLEMPELLKLIPTYADEYNLSPTSMIYIEPKASGKSLRQMLKQQSMKLNPIEISSTLVNEGKEARIQVAAPKVQIGRVTIVKGAWNDEFIGQLEGFPTAKHDEFVDLLGYACEKYLINTFFAI